MVESILNIIFLSGTGITPNKTHPDGTVRISEDADSGTVAIVVIACVTCLILIVAVVRILSSLSKTQKNIFVSFAGGVHHLQKLLASQHHINELRQSGVQKDN